MDRLRVLDSTRAADEFLLLDPETADPTYVARTGYDDPLAEHVAAVEPGNLVACEVDWTGERPRFDACEVVERTRFAFARDVTNLFEAAVECWREAEHGGEAMNSRLTRGTDGDVNGVCYVFADQPGQRDLFEEFRDGTKPLDPLLAAVTGADPPYEVFVLDPADHPFVVVYIALERGGLLARTVRETYGLDGEADDGSGRADEDGGDRAGGDDEFGGLADLDGLTGPDDAGDDPTG
ncbi:DUF6663 family protein [Halomarina litorea]|uniref:DUF6663 family protein n=1 Tax=Halomarina litorea TaxID=2961595 RepID=UPI0020C44A71|nr:DUF6663 family protein [Halomarina sp. BCD28]